jgi:(R)-2-hydroxyacyl-CoA dehydratese activating ATPase
MMELIAGIDIGARGTKAVVIDRDGVRRGSAVVRTKPPFDELVEAVLATALEPLGAAREQVGYIITTGFGRASYEERDNQVTDITAAAYGARVLHPATRCVIDIGSQSSRAIHIDERGRVTEFKSNDKCAAGAGGFVERAARYLEIPLQEVGDLSLAGQDPVPISSICAVLAESEIINHVSQGRSVQDILRGVHDSLAERAIGLLKRVGIEPEVTLVGGMARQHGMITALQTALGLAVNVPAEPDTVNAFGAALLAKRRLARVAA